MDLERNVVATERAPHPSRRVERRKIEFFLRAEDGEAPEIPSVDDGPITPSSFGADKDVPLGCALIDVSQQALDLDHDSDGITELGLPLHAEGEHVADPAGRAGARDHVLRAERYHFFNGVAAHARHDVVRMLLETLQC